jgi:hypothetical protein
MAGALIVGGSRPFGTVRVALALSSLAGQAAP